MGVNYLLALLLVYPVLALLFESLAQPLAILSSIPFAIPGAAWLAATDAPFNLMSQIARAWKRALDRPADAFADAAYLLRIFLPLLFPASAKMRVG